MYVQIVPQEAKPLSFFTNEEGMRLLMGRNYQQAETKPFALADLTTSASLDDAVIHVTNLVTVKDLLSHLGVDLALRCLRSEPQLHSKEYAKRELISPLLHVASVLAGKHLILVHYSNLSWCVPVDEVECYQEGSPTNTCMQVLQIINAKR